MGLPNTSSNKEESPRTEIWRMRPFFADTEDRRPASNSRARSGNKPVSSTTTRSKLDECPADRSELNTSMCSRYGIQSCRDRGISDNAARPGQTRFLCSRFVGAVRAAFSFVRLAIAIRKPGIRSGPTRKPRPRMPQIADLAFLRPQVKALSCAFQPSRRKSAANAGSSIGSPARGCPGGTTRFSRRQRVNAPIGSAGFTGSGGFGFAASLRLRR